MTVDKPLIRKMARQGMSFSDIGKELGVAASYVSVTAREKPNARIQERLISQVLNQADLDPTFATRVREALK